ncbi:MAG: HAD family hydrolase [Magnetovibrio sp.]|nr:HAD family hydrolase [Magnetovibrio sp.]
MFEGANPQALIFDWDNTLVDTWAIIHDALNTTLETFGKDSWSLDETRTRVRSSMRDSFPDIFGDRWEAAGRVFYKRYGAIHITKLKQLAGATLMLERIAAKGLYLAVVSNKRGDYLRSEASHLGWSKFFDMIVGANDAKRDKPLPEPIYLALSKTNIQPGPEVWYVGDTDIDMHFAHRTGCVPVLMRELAPQSAEFNDKNPAYHFSTCMALCKYIDNL